MIRCRRCSECVGAEHHWLEPEEFIPRGGDPEDEDDVVVLHRCKHCEAVKPYDFDEEQAVIDRDLGRTS